MGEYVQIGDVKTWYEVAGPDGADPVVLLHGGMSDGTAWGANAPAMAERSSSSWGAAPAREDM